MEQNKQMAYVFCVIPAQAGIQKVPGDNWTCPVFSHCECISFDLPRSIEATGQVQDIAGDFLLRPKAKPIFSYKQK